MDKEKQIEICEKAIRSSKDKSGALANLLNQEIEELQRVKEKQIEEMAKIMCGEDCEECAKESAIYQNISIEETCLSHEEIIKYANGKKLYYWHISDLKIYDKPRELSEFKKENKCYKKGDLDNIGCWERGCIMQEQGLCDGRFSKITRSPQSWQFIESLGE